MRQVIVVIIPRPIRRAKKSEKVWVTCCSGARTDVTIDKTAATTDGVRGAKTTAGMTDGTTETTAGARDAETRHRHNGEIIEQTTASRTEAGATEQGSGAAGGVVPLETRAGETEAGNVDTRLPIVFRETVPARFRET